MVELLLNQQPLSLDADTSVTVVRRNPFFSTADSIPGDNSRNLRIPRQVPENNKALGFGGMLSNRTGATYYDNAELYLHHLPAGIGQLRVQRTTQLYYECTLNTSTGALYESANKSLRAFTWANISTDIYTHPSTDVWPQISHQYPEVYMQTLLGDIENDYYTGSQATQIVNETDNLVYYSNSNLDGFRTRSLTVPFLFLGYVLETIATGLGYSMQGTWISSDVYRRTLLYSHTSNDFFFGDVILNPSSIIDPAAILPDVTLAELLKEVQQVYGVRLYVDPVQQTWTWYTLDELLSPTRNTASEGRYVESSIERDPADYRGLYYRFTDPGDDALRENADWLDYRIAGGDADLSVRSSLLQQASNVVGRNGNVRTELPTTRQPGVCTELEVNSGPPPLRFMLYRGTATYSAVVGHPAALHRWASYTTATDTLRWQEANGSTASRLANYVQFRERTYRLQLTLHMDIAALLSFNMAHSMIVKDLEWIVEQLEGVVSARDGLLQVKATLWLLDNS